MGLRGPGAKPVSKTKEKPKRPRKRAWERAGLSRAERVVAFIESLTITAGKGAGQRVKLRPWQRAFIARVYREENGRRIVRSALLSMGRKGGKTALAVWLMLAHLCGPEAEPRGECYSAASDRNQAGRVFREAEAIVLADADLAGRINVQRFAKRLEVMDGPGAGSIYEALSSDARKAHSLSPSFVICDELAQWRGRELFDNLSTGTGARDEPLIITISTMSNDPHSVMTELVDYALKIRDGIFEDETFVGEVYTVPLDADPWDESLWPLANPALGDFRSVDEMRKFAEQAKRIPAKEATFRLLYLNQPVDADERAISPADWMACRGEIDREALRGRPCWAGLDLSSTTDLTALVLYFPDDAGAVLPFFWVPRDRLAERTKQDRVPYVAWHEAGLIEAPEGRAIDRLAIARRLAEIAAEFDLQGLAYDRWRAEDLLKLLSDEGIELPVKPWGQGFATMGPAVDAMESAILDGKLRHDGNAVLTWNIANCVYATDPAGARKIAKDKARERVDGAVALCMAIGLHSKQPGPPQYDFDRNLVLTAA